jgi:Protein of unknown function (DUF2442)
VLRETIVHRVVKATAVRPYVLRLTFEDGRTAEIDLKSELHGEVFEPLLDFSLFSKVDVDPDFGSVFWPTGADLSPEFLVGVLAAPKL